MKIQQKFLEGVKTPTTCFPAFIVTPNEMLITRAEGSLIITIGNDKNWQTYSLPDYFIEEFMSAINGEIITCESSRGIGVN